MKERPIKFNAQMIQAIEEGRKTQTRRPLKPQPAMVRKCPLSPSGYDDGHGNPIISRYGAIGDRLWVKEAMYSDRDGMWFPDKGEFHFPETADSRYTKEVEEWIDKNYTKASVQAEHMPRWASRFLLETTDRHIERIQDITREGAIAEGLKGISKDGHLVKFGIPDRDGLPGTCNLGWAWCDWNKDPILAFKRLWDSIYGNWDLNPWVEVIEFKLITGEQK